MIKEIPSGIEPHVLFLDSTVGNAGTRRQILRNEGDKDVILGGIKKELQTYDDQITKLLVQNIFNNLVDGAAWNQDQRDCVLQIFPLINLGAIEPKILAKYYSSSLDKLKNDADPYGEIDAILQAGKIIAPYITQHRIMIGHRLNRLRTDFNKDEEAYAYIHNIQEEIEAIMLPPLSDIETEVKVLAVGGNTQKEMSKILNISIERVALIKHKLIQREEISPRHPGRLKRHRSRSINE